MSHKKTNKRLSGKFVSSFYIPFFVGTIISIISITIMFTFSSDYINTSEALNSIIVTKEFKKTLPLILSGIYSINDIFQLYINNLIKIQSYYKYNSKRLIEAPKDNINNIINKFSFNGVNKDQINSFHNLYKKYESNPEYLLNQVKWFISPEKTELDYDKDKNIINQLYSAINLIPLFKTILKLTNVYYTEGQITNQIYMMFGNSELFVKYPIVYNNLYGQDLMPINNPSNCKTKSGKFPEYYFFKCRPYYSYLLKEVQKVYNISISNVYKFLNGNYGLTICIHFRDTVDANEVVTLCHDLDMNYINVQLDSINNNIPGYIFLLKTGSEVPVYYPVEFKDSEYINLANMEFSIKNDFYNDEISLFIKKLPILINEYNYTKDTVKNVISFDLSKNNEKYNYSLFPIFFEIPDIPNLQPIHLLTLVYVNPSKRNFEEKYIYSTVLIVVIYILMEFILLLLCKYLIISIAKNIVMPIKILKDLLEQDFDISKNDNLEERATLNNKTSNQLSNNNLLSNGQNKNILKENNIPSTSPQQKNENIELKNNSNLIQEGFDTNELIGETNNGRKESIINNKENKNSILKLKFEDDNGSSENSDSSFENDDDLDKTKYRSNNIEKLFMKLVDLKNAFKCLEDNKYSNDKLFNLVYAQNVFYDINNLEASSLCESNISSLLVKEEQFDKAISHLYNGIEDINRKIFSKSHGKNKDNKINIDELKKKIKSENLLNRYIKLFYCYKQYFKYIKKKYKMLQSKSKSKKGEYTPEIDSFYITHHIKIYKNCLDDYIYRVKEYFGGKDLCIGLLEKLEEKIIFELSFLKDVNRERENSFCSIRSDISTNNKSDKEKIISEIIELFKEVDKLNSNNLSINNYNVVHLINLLKYESEIVNAMDIPQSILVQKTNFLKGKFHLKCYDYKIAIEYFESAIDYGKIGDIEITINSLKHLIKIANVYKDLVENDIEFHSRENKKFRFELEEDKKRKKALNNFIENLNMEIQSYTYIPKDICIILNLGNLSGVNNLNIKEKISNIQKIITYIYEDITTNKDRIAILEFKNNNYRFFLSLEPKDEKNENKIKEVLENLEIFLQSSLDNGIKHKFSNNNNNLINLISNNNKNSITNKKPSLKRNSLLLQYNEKEKEAIYKNSECLFDSVKYCDGYLNMKQSNIIKNDFVENWIFFVTCGFDENEINEIIDKPINEKLFLDKRKNDNLIIIFYENISDDSKNKLKNWISFNKSAVLSKDHLEKLKDIMGTKGEIQKTHFELEKFKDKF